MEQEIIRYSETLKPEHNGIPVYNEVELRAFGKIFQSLKPFVKFLENNSQDENIARVLDINISKYYSNIYKSYEEQYLFEVAVIDIVNLNQVNEELKSLLEEFKKIVSLLNKMKNANIKNIELLISSIYTVKIANTFKLIINPFAKTYLVNMAYDLNHLKSIKYYRTFIGEVSENFSCSLSRLLVYGLGVRFLEIVSRIEFPEDLTKDIITEIILNQNEFLRPFFNKLLLERENDSVTSLSELNNELDKLIRTPFEKCSICMFENCEAQTFCSKKLCKNCRMSKLFCLDCSHNFTTPEYFMRCSCGNLYLNQGNKFFCSSCRFICKTCKLKEHIGPCTSRIRNSSKERCPEMRHECSKKMLTSFFHCPECRKYFCIVCMGRDNEHSHQKCNQQLLRLKKIEE